MIAGINFSVSDSTSVNLGWGYSEALENQTAGNDLESTMTIHANILWQPVRQMRLGWEVHWGEADYEVGSVDSAGAQFGAWFFF